MTRHFAVSLLIVTFLVLTDGTRVCVQPEQAKETQKKLVRIIVLGHETHGKSTLTSAITKVLSEEKRAQFVAYKESADPPEIEVQGVKVKATEVTYETSKQRYSHVDCHRNTDCVALLSSSKVKFDGAIVVVAANDGPMPQTREHLLLARKAGIPSIIVYINKIDLVKDDPELVELVELMMRELLGTYK